MCSCSWFPGRLIQFSWFVALAGEPEFGGDGRFHGVIPIVVLDIQSAAFGRYNVSMATFQKIVLVAMWESGGMSS